ncbi:hypothetical protein B0T10DRAFT_578052 [Thelonectria olida]|uniref:Uncharacterized protein n=1 Tax=Thelonectria olida TaxID=1576542 RepID=A0A9P8WGC8_9HYPO|nr:hypothetical protein B0T10DRAFT_578052 [Thelonectria olida]
MGNEANKYLGKTGTVTKQNQNREKREAFEDIAKGTNKRDWVKEINTLCKRKAATDQTTNAFFESTQPLAHEESVPLAQEMKLSNSPLMERTACIITVHKALCTDAENGSHSDWCPHSSIRDATSFPDARLSLFSASLDGFLARQVAIQKAASIKETSKTGASAAFRGVLLTIRSFIEASVVHGHRVINSTAHEHGPFLAQANMKSLMSQVGNSVNVAHATHLMDQLGALYAVVYGSAYRHAAIANQKMVKYIDMMFRRLE